MKEMVLILTGLPGVGKTTAAQFFISQNIPVVSLGNVTIDILRQQKKKINEANEGAIRGKLRHLYGQDYYARQVLAQVKNKFEKYPLVVIEGLRSEEERIYLKDNLPHIRLIYLVAKKKYRIDRLLKRPQRPMTATEITERDRYEINILRINKLKKHAVSVITNNDSIDNFYKKLKKLIYL